MPKAMLHSFLAVINNDMFSIRHTMLYFAALVSVVLFW